MKRKRLTFDTAVVGETYLGTNPLNIHYTITKKLKTVCHVKVDDEDATEYKGVKYNLLFENI